MEENAESTNPVKINKWRRVGRITESERLKIVKEVSETLDLLFGSVYNKQVRPGSGQNATEVEVAVAIRSSG